MIRRLPTARAAHAVLAGAQVLVAGTALADLIGPRWAALIALGVGAAQAAVATYQLGSAKEPKAPAAA